MDGLQWNTLLKWMIWGYPYFRKHPLESRDSDLWSCLSCFVGDSAYRFLFGAPVDGSEFWRKTTERMYKITPCQIMVNNLPSPQLVYSLPDFWLAIKMVASTLPSSSSWVPQHPPMALVGWGPVDQPRSSQIAGRLGMSARYHVMLTLNVNKINMYCW